MDEKSKEEQPASPETQDAPPSTEAYDASSLESTNAAPEPETKVETKKNQGIGKRIRGLITHLNIYFLLFILISVLALGVVFISFQKSKKEGAPTTITTQPLTKEALAQLQGSDAKVGDPKQTLTIESNAIFAGKVLIRDSLDVAGAIKVGGALSLPGISVSGTSTFDQINANNLAVAGSMTIQGQVNLKGINSTGGATFGGPISAPLLTVQSLVLSGDLQLTRHIDAGGGTPGKSDGGALGNGGTSSVSGTDTAGTVTINIGGSPGTGCFTTVNFTNRFNGTPHIALSPVGAAAAGLNWYINRSSSNFSICTTNPAPAGQSFSFDYVAVD